MTDDWMDDLQDWAGGVRPVGDPVAPVRHAVRRRRWRRAVLASGGAAVLVAATSIGITALPGASSDRGGPPPPAATSAPVETRFSCGDNPVFGDPPPIPDREAQQQVVERLGRLSSIWVRHAEATAMGVVALVGESSGDVGSTVAPEVVDRLRGLGASLVYEWDPTSASTGVDASGQVRGVLGWALDRTFREVRRATREIPGSAGLAYWTSAGAIRIAWKAPVPDAVAALAGPRPDGTRVVVAEVEYSERDVRRAQRQLSRWLRSSGRWDDWSTSYGCGDGSGLVVGMVPEVTDRAGLAEQIADEVGMPVMVIAEERPIPLGGLPVAPDGDR